MPIEEVLREYADALRAKFAVPVATWPEDQLKSPVDALVRGLGAVLIPPTEVTVVTEAPRSGDEENEPARRVDMAVVCGGALAGHIELKRPGLGADPTRLPGKHNKEQWESFRHYPNLIYTDGNSWALYRTGERLGKSLSLGDLTRGGSSALSEGSEQELLDLFREFFNWEPIAPRTSKGVADTLAPLCRVLRDAVSDALGADAPAVSALAADLRRYLMPAANNVEISDTYAQTVTYALLIGRFEGADPLSAATARIALGADHGLLAQVLSLLTDPAARAELGTAVDLLERVIARIDPLRITRAKAANPWLYFYEEFLAAYDPALRKKTGAYYTPAQVVEAQVRLVSDLLVGDRFGKDMIGGGFADDHVTVLDPAAGTGTYPLAVLQHAVASIPENRKGRRGEIASRTAKNVYAFELLVGPYSVAHLRMSRQVAESGGSLPAAGLQIYLADTLATHEHPTQGGLPFAYQAVGKEREAARKVKAETQVVVCIGNPPYLRGKARGEGDDLSPGGWVQWRTPPSSETVATQAPKNAKARQPKNATRRVLTPGEPGILEDYLAPARESGNGEHLKNLYNHYVYFWRWATWKVFEQDPEQGSPEGAGIVSFITGASYLRGPGFVGMRQHLRSTLDELWIIDLGGDNKGARRTENVFAIETPVAIAMGVRYGPPQDAVPAKVHYASLAEMTRAEKMAALEDLSSVSDLTWRRCLDGWQDPFLPADNKTYFRWPKLTDLFPWASNGLQFKRSWPIGETPQVLETRWSTLLSDLPSGERTGDPVVDASKLRSKRKTLFKESRDRKVTKGYRTLSGGAAEVAIADMAAGTTMPSAQRFTYRSFDRQWGIIDSRVGDYLRPALLSTHGNEQVYLTCYGLSEVLGRGPAAVVSELPPDLHSFRGSFGGRHVIPLWRDAEATHPNVTTGLLDALATKLGLAVSPEDLLCYCYGVLGCDAYVDTYWDELSIPGPRIPIPANKDLFASVVSAGRHLVWLHTFGERLGSGEPVPEGTAVYAVGIPGTVDGYPESFAYDPASKQLSVGEGRYEEVASEVWDYSISGMRVLESWLGYRMKKRAGKSGSDLDLIRPEVWPDTDGEELLTLIWILEHTIAAQSSLEDLLREVLASDTFAADDLPQPTDADREPPMREEDGDNEPESLFDLDPEDE